MYFGTVRSVPQYPGNTVGGWGGRAVTFFKDLPCNSAKPRPSGPFGLGNTLYTINLDA